MLEATKLYISKECNKINTGIKSRMSCIIDNLVSFKNEFTTYIDKRYWAMRTDIFSKLTDIKEIVTYVSNSPNAVFYCNETKQNINILDLPVTCTLPDRLDFSHMADRTELINALSEINHLRDHNRFLTVVNKNVPISTYKEMLTIIASLSDHYQDYERDSLEKINSAISKYSTQEYAVNDDCFYKTVDNVRYSLYLLQSLIETDTVSIKNTFLKYL
jgi:hypothetical protein